MARSHDPMRKQAADLTEFPELRENSAEMLNADIQMKY